LHELRLERAAFFSVQLATRAIHRAFEPLAVERLEQVIHRVHVEGLERVLIVGRHEHHGRHPVGTHRLNHIKPGAPRHLDVEKHEIRLLADDRLHRLIAVRRLANHLHAHLVSEQRPHAFAGKRFVITDEGADRGASAGGRRGDHGQIRRERRPDRRLRLFSFGTEK
jgi:hypothetical protein